MEMRLESTSSYGRKKRIISNSLQTRFVGLGKKGSDEWRDFMEARVGIEDDHATENT
jgi:hypothetical protein